MRTQRKAATPTIMRCVVVAALRLLTVRATAPRRVRRGPEDMPQSSTPRALSARNGDLDFLPCRRSSRSSSTRCSAPARRRACPGRLETLRVTGAPTRRLERPASACSQTKSGTRHQQCWPPPARPCAEPPRARDPGLVLESQANYGVAPCAAISHDVAMVTICFYGSSP